VHAERESRIEEVLLADEPWQDRIQRTLEHTYGKTPYFASCAPPLFDALRRASHTLEDVNYQTFLALLGLLEHTHLKVVRANEMPLTSTDPTDRLVEICTLLDADAYIAGRGGHNYMRTEAFEQAKITLAWQDYDINQAVYPQRSATFIPGLSIIDALFNIGPEHTKQLTLALWKPNGVAP
jgi:hypothetical protein